MGWGSGTSVVVEKGCVAQEKHLLHVVAIEFADPASRLGAQAVVSIPRWWSAYNDMK